MEWIDYLRDHPLDPEGWEWNWRGLSKNPNISMDLVKANPWIPWHWPSLSSNQTLTFSYVLAHPEIKWKYNQVLMFSILTLEEVLSSGLVQLPVKEWSWRMVTERFKISLAPLSANRHISLAEISAHPELSWSKEYLSQNPNLTMDFILSPPVTLLGEWDWKQLSKNPAITIEMMMEHPTLPWYPAQYNLNPSVRPSDLERFPLLRWNYVRLSRNPGISLDYMVETPTHGWNRHWMCINPARHLSEVLILTRSNQDTSILSRPRWQQIIKYVGKTTYLGMIRQEQKNPASYWSLLPPDMVHHYFSRYLRKTSVTSS